MIIASIEIFLRRLGANSAAEMEQQYWAFPIPDWVLPILSLASIYAYEYICVLLGGCKEGEHVL